MKIGEFARKNNISKDTIRYYMDFGLLFPQKIGGHYDFDERCQSDLAEIFRLKELEFSLFDIKEILAYIKIGKFTAIEKNSNYQDLFESKYKLISQKINELNSIKYKLENEIKSNQNDIEFFQELMGIPLEFIKNLYCPHCESDFTFSTGTIKNNRIENGVFKCKCEKNITIQDGIIITNHGNFIEDNSLDPYNVLNNYIKNTDSSYVENISKTLEWVYKRIDFKKLKGKIILELGSGLGFFLRSIMESLPSDSTYIAVDHDIRRQKLLKSLIEKSNISKNIIFICSDFLDLPLKKGIADILVDFTGSTSYAFEHTEFLLELMNPYTNFQTAIWSSFILFEKFSVDSFIEDKFKNNFKIENIKNKIASLGYSTVYDNKFQALEKGGPFENYFVPGEKVYSYLFIGNRDK